MAEPGGALPRRTGAELREGLPEERERSLVAIGVSVVGMGRVNHLGSHRRRVRPGRFGFCCAG